MKPTDKKFLWQLLLLVVVLLIIEWLKSGPFLHVHHGLLIKIKTFYIIASAVLIMYLNLHKTHFRNFVVFFGALWGLYIGLSLVLHLSVSEGWISAAQSQSFNLTFTDLTQIQTPFPMLIFWLAVRVLNRPAPQSKS